jgi:hypothetical protein
MAAVPALPRDYSLLPTIGADGQPIPPDERGKLQRSLETLFPDMLVHGTHSTLLGMTSSLTKVSGRTHQYFSRVSQILAFERMMRSFVRMTAAMSPFPVDAGAANYWTNMMMPQQQAASPWAFPAPQPKPSNVLPFFPNLFQPQPAKPAAPALPAFFANPFQQQAPAASQASVWPDYSALMIVPMALMMAAPSMDQMWGGGFRA